MASETGPRPPAQVLYAGPLSDFIARRDALSKELRAAGDRDAASTVKRLRKPSRMAWSLNRVVHEHPAAIESLDSAIADYLDAHAGDGDIRSAMTALRGSVREVAAVAAGAARSEALNVDEGDLSTAILAVLGSPESYDLFRHGCLADIPDAGGLDFLSSMPARPRLEVERPAGPKPAQRDPAELAALRDQVRQAAAAVASARASLDAAASTLADLDAEVTAAQQSVRDAQARLSAALHRREFARRAMDTTSSELRDAERAQRDAERALERLSSG